MVVRELHSFVVGRVEQMTKVVFQVLSLEVLIDNHLVVLQDILLLSLLQLLVVVILDLIVMEELVPLKLMFQLLLPMNKSVLVMVELVLVKVVQLLVAMTLPMVVVIVYRNQVLLLDQVDLPTKRHVLVPLLIQEHVREHLSAVNKMPKGMTNVLKLLVTQDGGLIDFLLKGNVILLVVGTHLNVAIMLKMVVVLVFLIPYHLDNLEQDLLILYKNVWLTLFVKHHLLSVVGMVEQMTKVVSQLVFLELLIEILVVLQDM